MAELATAIRGVRGEFGGGSPRRKFHRIARERPLLRLDIAPFQRHAEIGQECGPEPLVGGARHFELEDVARSAQWSRGDLDRVREGLMGLMRVAFPVSQHQIRILHLVDQGIVKALHVETRSGLGTPRINTRLATQDRASAGEGPQEFFPVPPAAGIGAVEGQHGPASGTASREPRERCAASERLVVGMRDDGNDTQTAGLQFHAWEYRVPRPWKASAASMWWEGNAAYQAKLSARPPAQGVKFTSGSSLRSARMSATR